MTEYDPQPPLTEDGPPKLACAGNMKMHRAMTT